MTNPALKTISFEAKTPLFLEGDEADYAYIIKKGAVQILKKGKSGRNVTIATATRGDIVGEMAIISNEPRSASVISVEPVEALAISKENLEKRLEKVDPFLSTLISVVVKKLEKTTVNKISYLDHSTKKKTITPSKRQSLISNFKQKLGTVNLLLADPNQQTRNSLRSGLYNEGLRDISDARDCFQAEELLENQQFDILILDASFGLAQVKTLVRKIRKGHVGNNPYMVILSLSANPERFISEALQEAGTDKIIYRPVSVSAIIEEIKNYSMKKRNFMLSGTYIGPEMGLANQPSSIGTHRIKGPNTLNEKIFNGASNKHLERKLDLSMEEMRALIPPLPPS